MLPALFAKLVTCVDPFIYTLNQPKIKAEISLRLHTLLPPDVNSPFEVAAAAVPYYNNRPSPSRPADHYINHRTTIGSQQHHSKTLNCRPTSNFVVVIDMINIQLLQLMLM